MSADVNIPDPININGDVSLGGGLDLNLDDLDLGLDNVRINNLPNINLNGNFALSSLAPVNLSGDFGINKLPKLNLDAAISKLPDINLNAGINAGLNDIRIKELPIIDLRFSLRPFELSIPREYKFEFGLFGFTILKLRLNSEARVILEDKG